MNYNGEEAHICSSRDCKETTLHLKAQAEPYNAHLGTLNADIPQTYGLGLFYAQVTDDLGEQFVVVMMPRESIMLSKDSEILIDRIRRQS